MDKHKSLLISIELTLTETTSNKFYQFLPMFFSDGNKICKISEDKPNKWVSKYRGNINDITRKLYVKNSSL